MTPAAKLAAYAVVLAASLGGGAVAGNAVGPIVATGDATGDRAGDATGDRAGDTAGDEPAGHSHDSADEPTPGDHEEPSLPGGVLVAAEGYRMEADETILASGSVQPFAFRITGPDQAAVDELHLVLVGSDLVSYAHLHPRRADDRTWLVDLPALAPGTYRAFADFLVPDGPELTLGLDLAVPGNAAFAPLPAPSATAAVDGYEVAISGTPEAGSASEVELTVTRDGEPVTDLEPYLGASGHLVAIRSGDLAYLHVHPLAGAAGPAVRLALDVPSPGDYRLFFDFSHGDRVHTAAFTVHVHDA